MADFDKAPLTGVDTIGELLRHLIHHGPARNEAEREELTAVVDRDDPDRQPEPEPEPAGAAEEAAPVVDPGELAAFRAWQAAQHEPAAAEGAGHDTEGDHTS